MAWRCLTRSRSNNKGSSTVVPVLSDGENYNDNGGNSSGTDGNNNGNRNNVNEIIGSSSSNNTGSSCGSSGGNHLKAKDDPLLKAQRDRENKNSIRGIHSRKSHLARRHYYNAWNTNYEPWPYPKRHMALASNSWSETWRTASRHPSRQTITPWPELNFQGKV